MEPSTAATTDARIASRTVNIGGLTVIVHGLSTLFEGAPARFTAVLLQHPRGQTQSYMHATATSLLSRHPLPPGRGVMVVTLDSPNHGTRVVADSALRTSAWRDGNESHAVDLFSSFDGAARDGSLVLDYLCAAIFPGTQSTIDHVVVAGISLGGHAAWSAAVNEPRVRAAGIVIGCPDFCALMTHRAEKSRLRDFVVGRCEAFPKSLLDVVTRRDPAAMGVKEAARRLQGKKIFLLEGGQDKLVPGECGRPFVEALQKESGVECVKRVWPEVGHAYPDEMREALVDWLATVIVPWD